MLELFDTVVAKSDRSLIGTVERTYLSSEAVDDLGAYLILQHLPVPQSVLTEFVSTGTPPRGYVFVSVLDEERGSFLASEDDLTLLCRSFDLGDIVKREDGITGTVVDVFDSYDIQPMWLGGNVVTHASALSQDHLRDCDPASHEECPHNSISNVPGPELTHKQSLFEDDLICYKEWLGVVAEVDVDVVVQFEDHSIVVLDAPDDLYMIIPEPDVPLVSLPEFDEDEIKRPDLPSAFQGHPWVIPTKYPRPCSFVVTGRNTLKAGRWIHGKYSSACLNGGIVLDLVPRQLVAQWLSCNPFAPLRASQVTPPAPILTLFANHNSYRSSTNLKPNPHLSVIDLMSPPRGETLRSGEALSDSSITTAGYQTKPANLHQDLKVGDCVRFRDSTAAAVKYQGREGTPFGKFTRISEESSHGWDLNFFKVIGKKQNVQVLWQDGTMESHGAAKIQRYGGFEPDFAPTDLVLNRAGLKQMRDGAVGSSQLRDFNEMTFFETPHSLHPANVGVIQSVDSRERIATVRWFQNPDVALLENGNRLSADSRLGPIGDVIEEVSLYEVMTFPAFDRRLRDVALLPPRTLSKRAIEIIHSKREIDEETLRAAITHTIDPQRIFNAVRDIVRQRGFFKSPDSIKEKDSKEKASGVDWLGEIISTDKEGQVTVRLSGAKPCRDIKVSPDEILAVIHLDFIEADEAYSDHSMDEDDLFDEYDDDESVSTISETVEYEGGERLDTDSGDENWESAEEDERNGDKGNVPPPKPVPSRDIEMTDAPASTSSSPQRSQARSTQSPSFNILQSHLPSAAPPPFEILSIEPPPDQYQPPNLPDPPTSSSFLKRIRQEQKVLSTSLPVGQIYVRTYESRLDLLRCLIIGPSDTPYEYAPFLIDLYLPPQFPLVPPTAHFHSWTSGLGRINPNLYEEGKICLSLLGTWAGRQSNENWSTKATILQILVSLQGLVMVAKPFFNEAGFENEEAGGGYVNESAQYSERAFVMARGFVKFALTRPPIGVEDILAWLYLPETMDDGTVREVKAEDERLLVKVVARAQGLIEASEHLRKTADGDSNADVRLLDGSGSTGDATKAFLRPLSKGAIVMLRRQLEELNMCLSRWWTMLKREREGHAPNFQDAKHENRMAERSGPRPSDAQHSRTARPEEVSGGDNQQSSATHRKKRTKKPPLRMEVQNGVRIFWDGDSKFTETRSGGWEGTASDGVPVYISRAVAQGEMQERGVEMIETRPEESGENPSTQGGSGYQR